MNIFISALVLLMPGVIAVSIHRKQLINITRENWQPLLWEFLLYSLAIIFVVNAVMFVSYPQRTVSFSPWSIGTTSHILQSSFIIKYTLFAVISALALPRIWANRDKYLNWWNNRKQTKLGDDE